MNKDRLKLIFSRQKELMHKYHIIEASSGLMQTEDVPVNIQSKEGQARIKEFAWRITEEIGESLLPTTESREIELIDALHFLTELSILVGKDYNTITDFDLSDSEMDYLELLYNDGDLDKTSTPELDVIVSLASLCNDLKNRPWKQKHVETDILEFDKKFEQVWITFMALLASTDLKPHTIYEVYIDKSIVNINRQDGGY